MWLLAVQHEHDLGRYLELETVSAPAAGPRIWSGSLERVFALTYGEATRA